MTAGPALSARERRNLIHALAKLLAAHGRQGALEVVEQAVDDLLRTAGEAPRTTH